MRLNLILIHTNQNTHCVDGSAFFLNHNQTTMKKNQEIAGLLYNIAELLELKGENTFKIRVYNKAACAVEGLSTDIREQTRPGRCVRAKGQRAGDRSGHWYGRACQQRTGPDALRGHGGTAGLA